MIIVKNLAILKSKVCCRRKVILRLIASYTPHKNGSGDRKNRNIVELVRTLKYHNNENIFPQEVWAELVPTAIYILNRTGNSSIYGMIPYEVWLGKKLKICMFLRMCSAWKEKNWPKAVRLIEYDSDIRYRIYVKEQCKTFYSVMLFFMKL